MAGWSRDPLFSWEGVDVFAASIERHRQGKFFRVRIWHGERAIAHRNAHVRATVLCKPITLEQLEKLRDRFKIEAIVHGKAGTERYRRWLGDDWRETVTAPVKRVAS